MKKTYDETDIQVLSDKQHVRKRTHIYLGNTKLTTFDVLLWLNDTITISPITFQPAVYRCVQECVDNTIDEFTQCPPEKPLLKIEANSLLGTYTISDNGRGVPIGKHETGKHTPEVVFGELRSGRNFSDNKESGVIGMNGMGVSLTNICSTEFSIDIRRDGKRYKQSFSNGAEQVSKPHIANYKGESGTSLSFQLDSQVFGDTTLPDELLENKAIEVALTNPGITVEYNNKKYKFKKGFEDIIKNISEHYFKFTSDGIEFFVLFDVHEGIDEKIFTWVNSSLLFDGGLCNTQFLNSFCDRVIKHLEPTAKKQKCEVSKNDVRRDLLIIGNLRLSDPEYDTQAKTRLTGPNLRKEISDIINDQWSVFASKNKSWLNEVLESAVVRFHSSANKKAVKDHQKNIKKKVPGLIDATSKNRWETQLLVTEGLSAASQIVQVRNPKVHGSFPLTGKINNVYGSTIAQLLKMSKVTDLITAIGLVPGQKALRSQLNFGKVVIATDSDYDGADIMTLLVNLFYQYWPELFDKNYDPFVYRLIAPNVCASKGSTRIHFPSRNGYEKVKQKYKGWTISYFKGLGSMSPTDWKMILTGETDTLVPMIDDGNMEETLKLLFGPDADVRKKWLQN